MQGLKHLNAVALIGALALPRPGAAQAPAYRVVRTQDLSYGAVRRLNVRVAVPKHYAKPQIEAIARAVVQTIIQGEKVNAISIMFFGPGTSPDGAWDVASVDWAPNGRWSDAGNVGTGDYRTFRYSVEYRKPVQRGSAPDTLSSRPRRGLLGAPIPNGAKLLSRTPGDPAAGRDPTERYQVDASAATIAAYYLREMPKLGWAKEGTSTETILIFRKGQRMLGVLINGSGRTFTLMGS